MIRYYVAGMFLIPLLDWFDQLYERFGIKIREFEALPDKAIVFGTVVDVRINGARRDLRFVRIRLPIRTWGPLPYPYWREYGFRQHHFVWIEGLEPPYGGARIDPPLEG